MSIFPISLCDWSKKLELLSELIDAKIHVQLLSKKIGFQIKPISNDWVLKAAQKSGLPPEMIRNEIEFKLKELSED